MGSLRNLFVAFALTPLVVLGQEELSVAEPAFTPDSVLAGIHLCDTVSTIKVLGMIQFVDLIDDHRDMPRISFCNADTTEVLTVFAHYGSFADQYSEFRLSQGTGDAIRSALPVEHFTSGRSVVLGMSEQAVIGVFGAPGFRGERNDGSVDLRYSIANLKGAGYLERCNYPSYYAIFTFSKVELATYRFGFESP